MCTWRKFMGNNCLLLSCGLQRSNSNYYVTATFLPTEPLISPQDMLLFCLLVYVCVCDHGKVDEYMDKTLVVFKMLDHSEHFILLTIKVNCYVISCKLQYIFFIFSVIYLKISQSWRLLACSIKIKCTCLWVAVEPFSMRIKRTLIILVLTLNLTLTCFLGFIFSRNLRNVINI